MKENPLSHHTSSNGIRVMIQQLTYSSFEKNSSSVFAATLRSRIARLIPLIFFSFLLRENDLVTHTRFPRSGRSLCAFKCRYCNFEIRPSHVRKLISHSFFFSPQDVPLANGTLLRQVFNANWLKLQGRQKRSTLRNRRQSGLEKIAIEIRKDTFPLSFRGVSTYVPFQNRTQFFRLLAAQIAFYPYLFSRPLLLMHCDAIRKL